MAGAVATTTASSMTLVDWLDDLTVRFLLNLPPNELSSVPRICFQIEEAQWFYEDFIRPLNPTLPSLNLRAFLLTLFQHCPLLQGFDAQQHVAAYEEFLAYKVRVPVRGAILLDDSMEKVLLVRGWKKGATWGFPRGKINKDEKDLTCAIREVYEETGFDISATTLVESNQQPDGQVKSIEVTMQGQHMQLFVFRGVALDTHFEPKTRKEISKIEWYNIKDLPGFKKQKGVAAHGQGPAQSSKFYMVAPFLGQLKKWVAEQRKRDAVYLQAQHKRNASSANEGFQTITEDEGETEQEVTPDVGAVPTDRSADELKRLLSIGGSAPLPTAAHIGQPEQMRTANQPNNLLAMLHGNQPAKITGSIPTTPFEQIDPAFPSRPPQTPQAELHRQPSMGHTQAQYLDPHLAGSSHHAQQQHVAHQNYPAPPPGAAGAGFGPVHQHQQNAFANFPPHLQRELIEQHRQQQHFSGNTPRAAGSQYEHQANAAASSFNLFQQLRTPGAQPGSAAGPSQQWPMNAHAFQGHGAPLASPMQAHMNMNRPPGLVAQTMQTGQKPLGSEPSVPEASKLPAPKLNTHSMQLLDVLKSVAGSNAPAASSSHMGPQNGQRAGSQQQAALLNLFKKASISSTPQQQPTAEAPEVPAPASPALTDVTVKPTSQKPERRTTLNEITRTLPPKLKPKSPAPPAPLAEQQPSRAQPEVPPKQPISMQAAADSTTNGRPASRGKLFDPSNPQKFVRASSQSQTPDAGSVPPVAILQKHQPKAAPKAKQDPAPSENGHPAPQFSILQRPGSSTGKGPRSPLPQSPLRQEDPAPAFQPQLLKRPSVSSQQTERPSSASMRPDSGEGKKDHLLSLFSKLPGPAASPAATSPVAPFAPEPQRGNEQKTTLLGLFDGANAVHKTSKTPEPTPPPAPQLMPERKPSQQPQQPQQTSRGPQQQQLLLNLFSKQSSSTASSPGTPISPFTLGTPIGGEAPFNRQQLPLPGQGLESRSRLGSMASIATSNGTPTPSGQQTPTSATPTAETKDFLLGYLNGVVQKEQSRSRSAKRQ